MNPNWMILIPLYIVGYLITVVIMCTYYWQKEMIGKPVTWSNLQQFMFGTGYDNAAAFFYSIFWPVYAPLFAVYSLIFLALKGSVWAVRELNNPKENV